MALCTLFARLPVVVGDFVSVCLHIWRVKRQVKLLFSGLSRMYNA